MSKNVFTTMKGQVVPLENIDYIADLDCGQMWDDNYKIYLKSGTCINVSSGRQRLELSKDRDKLVADFTEYLENKTH